MANIFSVSPRTTINSDDNNDSNINDNDNDNNNNNNDNDNIDDDYNNVNNNSNVIKGLENKGKKKSRQHNMNDLPEAIISSTIWSPIDLPCVSSCTNPSCDLDKTFITL